MPVITRLTWDQCVEDFCSASNLEQDRIDFQEQISDELFDTGSVTVSIGGVNYEISLQVDKLIK